MIVALTVACFGMLVIIAFEVAALKEIVTIAVEQWKRDHE